jgi:hypothetical protein
MGGTRSYFRNEKPQILRAAVHNLVAQDLCTAGLLTTILCTTLTERETRIPRCLVRVKHRLRL